MMNYPSLSPIGHVAHYIYQVASLERPISVLCATFTQVMPFSKEAVVDAKARMSSLQGYAARLVEASHQIPDLKATDD